MARAGLALPLIVLAIITQGEFFRPSLAFTSSLRIPQTRATKPRQQPSWYDRSSEPIRAPATVAVAASEASGVPCVDDGETINLGARESLRVETGAGRLAAGARVRGEFDWELTRERGRHKYEMAKQRADLLEGMVPLSAHQAIVESYEKECKAAVVEAAASSAASVRVIAGDFARRQEESSAQIRVKDEALANASSAVRDMSDSLVGLKRDVNALRNALRSHAARTEESRRAVAEDIRRNEVVPERRRADEAEAGLSELRRSAHEWLATAHAVKLEAVTQALADGYLHGCGDGRAEAEADALRLELSLRTELDELRSDFALHRARSRETALTLTMAVSDATRETSEMVSAAAKAGASALMASQDVWKAEGLAEGYARGRAEGFVAGRLEGFSAGHAEGVKMDRSAAAAAAAKAEAAADDFTSRRVQVTEMGGKTAGDQAAIEGEVGDTMATATVAAMAPADDAERDLREAFAAYVVSAHDQKLSFARKEKFAAEEKARGLGEELAAARSVLAEVLQERISEIEARHNLVESHNLSAEAQHSQSTALLKSPAWLDAAASVAEQRLSSAFWQECGGAQQ